MVGIYGRGWEWKDKTESLDCGREIDKIKKSDK